MTFSWKQALKNSEELMIEYNIRQAKNGNTDYKKNHTAEARDATADVPNYTLLKKRIKEEVQKQQVDYQTRMEKINK